jgi:hypothetical protein
VEIEALPTGGWGYAYFPYVSRFVRPLDLPALSHTGRFFKSWGDNGGLKPGQALKYECCQILSQAMTTGVGDLLPPRAMPKPAVYDLIGKVYGYIEKCEPYVDGGEIQSQIALIVNPELGDNPGPSGLGATRALQQLRHQFDVIPPDADISGYELVIVPESTRVDVALSGKLKGYISAGGSLIVSGPAALNDQGAPVMDELGIDVEGPSPYSHTFLHASDPVSDDLADYGYVMYERGFRMTPKPGAESLVAVGEPYFERAYNHFSGHEYTPESAISQYSAAVRNGNVITFSVPILEAYGKHAAPNYRTLLRNCIALLLPNPFVRDQGPSCMEVTVMKQGDRTVAHILSFSAERRADNLDIVEDPFPLVDIPISIKLPSVPTRAYLAPCETDLEFNYQDGYAQVRVTILDGHALLVFE